MTKKVLSFISFGLSMVVVFLYLVSSFSATVSNGLAMLFILALCLPFLILGLLGAIFVLKKRILSGVFLILGGLASSFLGLMSTQGRLGDALGLMTIALGIVAGLLYIISGILAFAQKTEK